MMSHAPNSSRHSPGIPHQRVNAASPLSVSHPKRGELRVLGFTDIDGTAQNEELPERERIGSITPAVDCIARCQAKGVEVGIVTGRSFGETLRYASALGCRGPLICEDGAVLVLPEAAIATRERWPSGLEKALSRHDDRWVLRLSSITPQVLNAIVADTNARLVKAGLEPFLSSLELMPCLEHATISDRVDAAKRTGFCQEAMHTIGYERVEDLLDAAHRLSTCFLLSSDYGTYDQSKGMDERRLMLRAVALEHGVEVFAPRLPHLRGSDASKLAPLMLLNQHASLFFGRETSGILPLVWGNNDNDVKLMRNISALDGLGVVVGHPDKAKGHYVQVADVQSPDVYVAEGHSGYGMVEGLAFIRDTLAQRFGLVLAW